MIRAVIVRGIAWQRELQAPAPEFFQRFHREYALTTAVGGERRDGSQSVECMRGILAQHREEIAVDLDVAAFLLTRGAASVIGTPIHRKPA